MVEKVSQACSGMTFAEDWEIQINKEHFDWFHTTVKGFDHRAVHSLALIQTAKDTGCGGCVHLGAVFAAEAATCAEFPGLA